VETALYYKYWGKARPEGEAGPAYHLLPYHCLDVAAVACCLLSTDKPLVHQLAKQLNVDPLWFQRWLVFCLAIHDLGKFARAFQGLKTDLSDNLVKANPRMHYEERHDSLGFCIWDVLQNQISEELSQKINQSISTKYWQPWLEIVTGHHGMPPKKSLSINNFFQTEDKAAALAFIQDVADLLLSDFDFQPLQDKSLAKHLKAVSWQIAGVTVLADWLGSNQTHFSYCSQVKNLDDYWQTNALPSAQKSMQGLPEPAKIQAFQGIDSLFSFIKTPTPLQHYAVTETLSNQPQLFILEDVTGAGKTEAALVLAHRLMAQGLADGLYIALPTMATTNAMYQRLSKVYRQFYQADSQPSLVLAHGARQLSEAFQQSVAMSIHSQTDADYQTGNNEREQELSATAYCNAWLADSRKKALLADVGVGTLDQALLAVLPARHQSLRLLGLGRKVLLVDEVHAYDSYMQKLLDALLEAHARQGGSVILLSATLPQTMRKNLVDAFHRGLNQESPLLNSEPGYPLVTHTPANAMDKIEQAIDTREEVKRTVKIQRLDGEQAVMETIQTSIAAKHCVCWIRNTVKSARLAYQLLIDAGVSAERITLFHSRFAMIDRQAIETDVLAKFGKHSTAQHRQGQILIATQVVEQSLDLDFDVMVTDLAPIDLIIQRAGRLRRHIRDRHGHPIITENAQDQRGEPVLYLHTPKPSDDADGKWLKPDHAGTQAVYPHIGQLWLTAKTLLDKGRWTMPKDARELIERVYSVWAIYPEALERQSFDAEGANKSRESMAELNVLKLDKGYTRNSGDWDEETKIPTRLTEQETISVALATVAGEQLIPYAASEHFAWALSTIKLPDSDWRKVKQQIPAHWQTFIEQLKQEQPAVRWLEILPLENGQQIYSSQQGFMG
jgi:CRISPR-associated endonuclease/helicase Cas3